MRPTILLAALALFVAPALAGDVIHVPADVTFIEDAVALASPGDVVLVDAATYVPPDGGPAYIEHLDVSGKGISLIAVGGLVELRLGEISAVPEGETFALRGFELGGGCPEGSGYAGLVIQGCPGRVRIEECTLRGLNGGLQNWWSPKPSGPGLSVEDSASVVLRRCEILGAPGGIVEMFYPYPMLLTYSGGHGLVVHSSRVAVYDSHLEGGVGVAAFEHSSSAGDGVRVAGDTRLHVAGSTVEGGHGPSWPPWSGGHGGPGGDGVHQLSPEAATSARDTTFVGGAGGDSDPVFGYPPGHDGQALAIEAGGLTEYPAPYREFELRSPAWEGGAATLHLDLLPGDLALLVGSLDGEQLELPSLQGVLLVGASIFTVVLDPPAGGSELPVRLPRLPPTVQALDVTLQLVVQSADGELLLGPASGMTLLSPDAPVIDWTARSRSR